MTDVEHEVIEAALALSEERRRAVAFELYKNEAHPQGRRFYRALVALDHERAGPVEVERVREAARKYQATYEDLERQKRIAFEELCKVQSSAKFSIYQHANDLAWKGSESYP